MSTAAHISRALSARGLNPEAKLVLLIVAAGADMDGRYDQPLERLADCANITDELLVAALTELVSADLVEIDSSRAGAGWSILLLGVEPDGR